MKTILRLITAALALAGIARGQSITSEPIWTTELPTTFSIAAATTNSTLSASNVVIAVTRTANVALQIIQKLQGAGTSAVVWKFDESVDGSTWESGAHSLSVTASSTNQVTTVANYALNGIMYLRLSSCENPNASAVTNISIWKGMKGGN